VVIDAGANIGWYSMLLDRLARDGTDIFAFEPDVHNRSLLERNVELNRARHVHVVPCALGESSGSARLYRYPGKNLGRHSLIDLHEGHSDGGEVRVTSLIEFWAAQGLGERALRFVKIDVEGYEIFVLRGMGELLRRCELILLEYSPAYMAKLGVPPAELVDLMTGAGLLPYRVTQEGCVALDRASLLASERQQNLMWRRTGCAARS
jgi:FkbM family methyltransferase